ncbi:hypothetical protein [Tuberibacillus calidus]|jgi:hypothetical protein|uniref:hypothetical protein n=1 Tax=Tuberibacillus calidus TaxID=340097 RepID=UPI0004108348|nr:hypothetical protein [Tuberibacillus calidus]
MTKKIVILNLVDFPHWETLIDFYFDECDAFEIFFPDDTESTEDYNPLITGYKDFLNLPQINVNQWDGMENSVCITGPLNDEAKNTFYKYVKDNHDDKYPARLWTFFLVKNKTKVFKIDDFTVCILETKPELMEKLNKLGIDFDDIDNINVSDFDFDDV